MHNLRLSYSVCLRQQQCFTVYLFMCTSLRDAVHHADPSSYRFFVLFICWLIDASCTDMFVGSPAYRSSGLREVERRADPYAGF